MGSLLLIAPYSEPSPMTSSLGMNRYAKLILGFGFLSRLTFVWRDFSSIPLIDDCFYNFFVAKNLALGNGLTFDGTHLTNGIHPLLTLLITGVYYVFPDSESAPIRSLLLINSFLSLFSAIFLFKVIKTSVNERVATVFLLLFYLSIYALATDLNGLDTCLNNFLLSSTLLFYFTKLRGKTDNYIRNMIWFSLLCGLLALSRLDNLAFVLALLFDHLFIDTSRTGMRIQKIRGLLINGLVILLFLGPWFFYNLKYFGDLLPVSGQTVRLMSVFDISLSVSNETELFDLSSESARNNEVAIQNFYEGKISPFVYLKCLGAALGTIVAFGIPLMIQVFAIPMRLGAPVPIVAAAGILLLLVMICGVIWSFRKKVKLREVFVEPFRFLLIASLMFLGLYLFVVLGYMFYYRYMFPMVLVFQIFLSIYVDRMLPERLRLFRKEGASLLTTSFLLIYLVQIPVLAATFRNDFVRQAIRTGDWIEENIGKESLVGVVQSGIIKNFSDANYLILENKLNPEIDRVFKEKGMFDYLVAKGAKYIVDEPRVLQICLIQRSRQDLRGKVERIHKGRFWVYEIKAQTEEQPSRNF